MPGLANRIMHRRPTALKKEQMSLRIGGGSGPNGQRALGRVEEESSPRRGIASGRGTVRTIE